MRDWPSSVRYAAALGLLVVVLILAIALRPVLPALSIAALLAYLLNPFVHLFMKWLRLQRVWAARLTYALFLLLLVNVPAWSGAFLFNEIDTLLALVRTWTVEIWRWLSDPIVLGYVKIEPERVMNAVESSLQNAVDTVPAGSLSLLTNVTTNLLWAIVIFVVLYYLLKDGPALKGWLVSLAPVAEREELATLIDEADAIWSRFLRIQVLMFLLLTILMMAGTVLVLWSYRVGFIGQSPLILLLLLIALYTLLQQLDNLWLRPRFLGRSLHLHPGVVFVGLIAGLIAGGFLGALIAVPMIATARVVGRYLRRKLGVSRQ